jgi:hypothetical protein
VHLNMFIATFFVYCIALKVQRIKHIKKCVIDNDIFYKVEGEF